MCGNSTSTSNTNTSNSFAPWVTGAGQNIYNSAAGYANSNPYQVYSGPTSAAANPAQSSAINYLSGQLGQTNPYTTQAAGLVSSAGNAINPNLSVSQLMNPYAQSALAPTLQAINDTAAQQHQQNGANAAMNGAFGGSAAGVADALTNRYQQQNIGNATAQGMSSAFNAAQGQQNANLQNLISSGNSLSGIGQQAFGQGTTLASLLGGLGAQQQNIGQQGISNAMTVNQQANTGQMGQFATLASLLGAIPKDTTGTQAQTTTQPDNVGWTLLGSLL